MYNVAKRHLSIWSTATLQYNIKTCKCDCSSKRKFYNVLFGIVVFILPLIAILIVKIENFAKNRSVLVAEIFLIITYLVVLILICEMISESYKSKYLYPSEEDGRVTSQTRTHFIESKKLKTEQADLIISIFVTILGLGNATFQLTIVGNEILMLLNNENNTRFDIVYGVFAMLEHFTKCICDLCLLLFIINHEKFENILKCVKWKPFIGFLSLSSFCQWLFIIFQEINYEHAFYKYTAKAMAIIEHKSILELSYLNVSETEKFQHFNKIQQFLYPFGIEFQLTCFIELLSIFLWQTNCHYFNGSIFKKILVHISQFSTTCSNLCDSIMNVCRRQIFCCFTVKIRHQISPKQRSHIEHTFKLLAFVFSNLMISLLIVILFFQESNVEYKAIVVRVVTTVCNIVLISMTSLYSIFLYFILHHRSVYRKEHEIINKVFEKRIDFIALVVSNMALITFKLITIIADVHDDIPVYLKALEITLLTLSFMQSTLQIFLSWVFIQKIKLDGGYIQVLVALNFAIWLTDTFSIFNDQTYGIRNKIYGDVCSELWNIIALPLAIFYRMHSCVVLIKINSDEYYCGH